MKRFSIIAVLCILAMAAPVEAKEKKVVAILPFNVHSSENIEFIRQGIADMLASRISVSDKIEVLSRDAVLNALKADAGKELSPSLAYELGTRLGADFVVWGSITKIGNSLSIDGKLFDVTTRKSEIGIFTQSQNMDEVIPKINEFAQRIDAHILGAVPSTFSPLPQQRQQPPAAGPSSPAPSRESEIISSMRGGRRGTFTSAINPDFINAEQPLNRATFWKSQQFPYEIRGIDIGDVNDDGLNETVAISPNTVFIYQRKGDDFRLLQRIVGQSHDNYIAVDVADINGNGKKEIIVSSISSNIVNSFVVEYRDGKFAVIASDLPWFLRVIEGSEGPVLMGQRRGLEKNFDTPIHRIVWQEGRYQEGPRMRIPEGLSVYGLTIEKLGAGGSERIVALDDWDYLCVFEQTDKPLSKVTVFGGSREFVWKSEDVFGGSNTFIEPANFSGRTDELREGSYVNHRIIPYDTNKDGKKEFIVVKNISSAARLFQRIKFFTSGEVYNLEWDGMGKVENWRTKKINGYVADLQFKDIDNDGQNEVVLALVVSSTATSARSVVVAYDLQAQ